jgi:hypothetical protein
MTTSVRNARDKILQAAVVRAEPVTLPPTVVVPPSQLGTGALPGTVTGADGSKIVSATVLRTSTLYTDQIRGTDGTLMFQANKLAAGNVTGLGSLALRNSVLAGEVSGLGALATRSTVYADELGVGTLAAGIIYSGTVAAENLIGGSFFGKEFTGGKFTGSEFVGNTFVGGRFTTNVVTFEKAEASVYVDTWDLFVKATAWLTYVNIDKSINAAGASLDINNITARGTTGVFNLGISGQITTNVSCAGSLTAANLYSNNDVTAPNIYANNLLSINGSLGGATGGRVVLASTRRWCKFTIDGVEHTTTIEFGALA